MRFHPYRLSRSLSLLGATLGDARVGDGLAADDWVAVAAEEVEELGIGEIASVPAGGFVHPVVIMAAAAAMMATSICLITGRSARE